MHPDLIRQLDQAVTEVFSVMLNLSCKNCPAKTDQCGVASVPCYTATISFTGGIEGTCTLHLEQTTAANLAETLIGLPTEEISQEYCADTTAELCNMIAGNWKTRHPTLHTSSQLSCPTVTLCPAPHHTPAPECITLRYCFGSRHLTLHLAFD